MIEQKDDELATLDLGSELPPHLYQLFARAGQQQLAVLAEQCERRDQEGARAQAHKLKGGLYAAGASRLADALEELRGALARGDWTSALQNLARIRTAFARVTSELERRSQAQNR